MKDEPTTGSPPMPTMVELPRPRCVSSWRLVGQRARARDEADVALGEDLGGDDPDVRLARRESARAVRAQHRDPLGPDEVVDAQHFVRRQPFGDADHGADPGIDGLVDGIRGKASGDEDHRRVGARLRDGVRNGVEDRDALEVGATLARSHARDDLRAVRAVPERVERALAPSRTLHDQPCVLVDHDCH